MYEFDFNLKDALQGLAETHFLISEYRQRLLEYKYAKYKEQDRERKIKRAHEKNRENEVDDNINENELIT